MKKTGRNPLMRTMLIFCVMFALIFSICVSLLNFFIYERDMLNRYHAYTADILNYVARVADGEDLAECMKTGKKSEKYEELQKLTNDLKETHKLEFLYIIRPISENPPDNMMDVLAAYTKAGKEAGTDGLTDLGNYTGDAYPPDVARQYLARMDYNPEVTFFQNDTTFGNIYTAIRPIFNNNGQPVAVLCADVLIDEIDAARINFIKMAFLYVLAAGIVLVAGMSYKLKSRVVDPIKRMKNSAISFASRCHGKRNLDELYFEDPKIETNDELEDLSGALSSMCNDMKSYTAELILADRERSVLKEKVVKMDTLAYKDALTGAGNKAAYEKCMGHRDWDIFAKKADFSIVMTDLNYLKRINDTFGHDRGDAYILKFFEILREIFHDSKIFRIGGDEFVIVLDGEKSSVGDDVVKIFKDRTAELLKDSTLEPWERVSAAIGIAKYDPKKHKFANDVFKEADANMYDDKRANGGGRE